LGVGSAEIGIEITRLEDKCLDANPAVQRQKVLDIAGEYKSFSDRRQNEICHLVIVPPDLAL
jgi:hypothetical protein